MRHARALILPAILVTLAILPASASASKSQEAVFQDDALLLASGVAVQVQLLNEIQALGADTIHAVIYWPKFVPGSPTSRRKPRGNSASPGYYPPDRWDPLDSLVRETRARGMSLIVAPAGSAAGGPTIRVPRWARTGSNSPKVNEYSKFMAALGRRYNGRYQDENGGILPRVSRWSIWNEPNQGGWIQPQWKRVRGRQVLFGAKIYRDLYRAGQRALRGTGHRSSKLYLGELAPVGAERRRRNRTSATSPGIFLREMACVDSRVRPYRGADARRRSCTGYKRLSASGIAHHIYTEGRGQPATYKPRNPDEMPVGALDRLERLVSKLKSRRRLSAGGRFLNLEFGFQSNPPDRTSGVSLDAQAENENVSEYLQYRRSRWIAFTHYLMVDDLATGPRHGGFQTGLKFLDGREKPAYAAYRLPIVVRRSGGGVRVWGANRPRGGGSSVAIFANGVQVATVNIGNPRGYFDRRLAVSPGATFQLVDPVTGGRSRLARVSRRVR